MKILNEVTEMNLELEEEERRLAQIAGQSRHCPAESPWSGARQKSRLSPRDHFVMLTEYHLALFFYLKIENNRLKKTIYSHEKRQKLNGHTFTSGHVVWHTTIFN